MPDPMTPARLDEITALADAATPGPWTAEPHWHFEKGCRCLSCHVTTGWHVGHPTSPLCEEHPDAANASETCMSGVLSSEDATFAAAARTAVPELIAEIRRLQAENAKLREDSDWLGWLDAAGVDNWEGYSVAQDMRDEAEQEAS